MRSAGTSRTWKCRPTGPALRYTSMSNDSFALPSAFRSLERFLETLAAELRDRRAPLETALADLLFVWDMAFGPHELAARFDAVGAVVRDAGLGDEVRRVCDVLAG